MNIILLYGPGEVAKRARLSKLKASFDPESIFTLDLKQDSEEKISALIYSNSLFAQKKLVVIENVSPALELKQVIPRDGQTTVVLIGQNLPASASLLKEAKSNQVTTFKFEAEQEVSAFPYLDNLLAGNSQALLELDKLLREFGGIYVLSMIYYGLRRNLLPSPTSAFMQQKIKAQRARFKESDWPRLYQLALNTEFKIKSGLLDEVMGLTVLTQAFLQIS